MRTSPMSLVAGSENAQTFNPHWSLVMKLMNLRKTLSASLLIGGPVAATSAQAQSQGGSGMGSGMMSGYGNGWMDGYGGAFLQVLLVAVITGLLAWIVVQKKE